MCEGLDRLLKGETRRLLSGRAAIQILAKYGAIAKKCAWAPEGVKLAIVIDLPSVWFCPSEHGADGVFLMPYSEEKFGTGIEFLKKDYTLRDYNSFQARIDGWDFAAAMIATASQKGKENGIN